MGGTTKVKMMRYNLCFIIAIVMTTTSYGQSDKLNKNRSIFVERALDEANIMGQAYLKSDYQTFARYTYPSLLMAMGGESRMAATLRQAVTDMQKKGMSFNSIVVDSPSKIVRSGNELQCTLQQHTSIKLANGHAVTTSTLIAISNDGGKNWTFVDTNNKTTVMMKKALPNLSSAILIPPQQKPVFYNF